MITTIIGSGNMGGAIARGLAKCTFFTESDIGSGRYHMCADCIQ